MEAVRAREGSRAQVPTGAVIRDPNRRPPTPLTPHTGRPTPIAHPGGWRLGRAGRGRGGRATGPPPRPGLGQRIPLPLFFFSLTCRRAARWGRHAIRPPVERGEVRREEVGVSVGGRAGGKGAAPARRAGERATRHVSLVFFSTFAVPLTRGRGARARPWPPSPRLLSSSVKGRSPWRGLRTCGGPCGRCPWRE
jgi:hypothetical protein